MYKIDEELCTGCGVCSDSCPVEAIKEGSTYVITTDCTDCGTCEDDCPVGAISQ